MRESDFPIECFEFGEGEAETERRVWINEFSNQQDMLNVPKTVNALLKSASIREAEMLDWKAWMPEVFNLIKKLYKEE